MKLTTKYFKEKIKQNLELFFVFSLILLSILVTQFFHFSKNHSKNEYINLINNIYFKKTINNIFENFEPKYIKIEHKISKNESITTILKNYNITEKELNLLNKNLKK